MTIHEIEKIKEIIVALGFLLRLDKRRKEKGWQDINRTTPSGDLQLENRRDCRGIA